jgi:tetratricopeptide (TPR) repeat protein
MKRFMIAVLFACAGTAGAQSPAPAAQYQQALDLIHEYNGSGDQLGRAMQIAEQLMSSQPQSGYAQTLIAEMISTWQLKDGGEPKGNYAAAMQMTEQALTLNPALAQAHVARARALLKSGLSIEAGINVDAALAKDPQLSGAQFMKADLYRRTNRVSEAETWYRKFIEGVPAPQRKANGYAWMGDMYKSAAHNSPREWAAYIAKARDAYQKGVDLDPQGPWRTVNFAVFLNNEAGDFDAAATYAARALKIMDFPMARYHLAAARYQKLSLTAEKTDKASLGRSVAEIHQATSMSLQQTLDFCTGCSGIRGRLETLKAALAK